MTADNLTVNGTAYRWPNQPPVVTGRPVSAEYAAAPRTRGCTATRCSTTR